MNEQIMSYVRNPVITLVGGGVAGIGIGAGVASIINRRRMAKNIADITYTARQEYKNRLKEERAQDEVILQQSVDQALQLKSQLEGLVNTVSDNLDSLRPGEEPEMVIERIVQPTEDELIPFNEEMRAVIDEGKSRLKEAGAFKYFNQEETLSEATTAVVRNIFDGTGDDTWDYERERSNRTADRPYVIHVDEFTGEEMGYEQSTLTWYERDRILTDEKEVPIYNHEEVVGNIRFGHGSKDPNTCFVRNEAYEAEYEILRHPGSYQEEVLGLDPIEAAYEAEDIKHSKQPGRFRVRD